MPFILSAQRNAECSVAFQRYREYVAASRQHFPPKAYALASSDWYFDPREHRCPHDAWLESATIFEPATGERAELRTTAIRVRLLGAYHDGFIEFLYPSVFTHSLSSPSCAHGLGDWLYDEFRVSPSGHLIHEIEWAGTSRSSPAHWIIEASDVEFQWIAK